MGKWLDSRLCPLESDVFPPGKTPLTMYVSFWGIKCGAAWHPPFPGPPNEVFACPQIAVGVWQGFFHNWIAGTRQLLAIASIDVNSEFFQGFHASKFPGPMFAAANEYVDPTLVYYGGFASVTWGLVTANPAGAGDVAAFLGLSPAGLKFDPIPVDESYCIYRYAFPQDGTRIRVKMLR